MNSLIKIVYIYKIYSIKTIILKYLNLKVKNMVTEVGVIGAGALGTAIAQSISTNSNIIHLYARREEVVNEINISKYNSDYYPNLRLNEKIVASSDFKDFSKCEVIFLCIPSKIMRNTMQELIKIVDSKCIFVSAAKGIESSTLKRMSQIMKEYTNNPPVVLSGPNIASEIAVGLPTATTIASEDHENLKIVKNVLSTLDFKVSSTNDVIGTELSGIIKNILAISLGICEGMGVNDNARFAVLTKGFCETKEIIKNLGGNPSTVDSYCGFGDIVTASTLSVSRNHTLGVFYGQKIIVDEKSSGIIFEGKNSVKIIKKICTHNKIKSSVVDFVYEIIVNQTNPEKAFKKLWEKIE